jgi:hypothetical protein
MISVFLKNLLPPGAALTLPLSPMAFVILNIPFNVRQVIYITLYTMDVFYIVALTA